ncbi:MAG: hypothetical protein J6Y90_01395, partial [Lachnospiraceae bacterium]|nr:hypothetical protein [Lachnospiraceae bacterium]
MTRKVVLDMESRTYDLHQLTDSFRRLYAENIAEAINWGDMVEVYGAVDEDKRMRTRLIDELEESVDRVGAYLDAQIVYASRSGYSWLTEYVIPRLRGLKPRKVIIQVKPVPAARSEADTDANLDGETAVPCDGEKTVPCDGEKAVPCDGEKAVP